MKIAYHTLGCKVNLFETQALEQLAIARGHQTVTRDADAVILNTCTVTAVSDRKNLRALRKLKTDNPCALIAACGCLAEVDPTKLEDTGLVDLLCGTHERAQLLLRLENEVEGCTRGTLHSTDDFSLLPAGVPHGRTRALLKIEDGCDYRCAYCIIPKARGRVRSMPLAQVLEQTDRLACQGVHEIVLTGIELASYGRDLTPRTSLLDLLVQLLSRHPAVRFRLGSLDPRVTNGEFCQTLAPFDNLARHFHLSLQSGSDSVLQRMKRHYTTALYLAHVGLLRDAFADCSITTDLIVGYPGESEQEFVQTLDFLTACGFASVHVFPFSARAGTVAATLPDQIPAAVRAARAALAKEHAASLRTAYLTRFIGRTLSVLPEHQSGADWPAHSRYEFPVYLEGAGIVHNAPCTAHVTALYRDGVRASVIADPPCT